MRLTKYAGAATDRETRAIRCFRRDLFTINERHLPDHVNSVIYEHNDKHLLRWQQKAMPMPPTPTTSSSANCRNRLRHHYCLVFHHSLFSAAVYHLISIKRRQIINSSGRHFDFKVTHSSISFANASTLLILPVPSLYTGEERH